MSDDSIAVKVKNVSKVYKLYDNKQDRVLMPFKKLAYKYLKREALQIENRIKRFHAVNNVSFEIKKGESWGFIGVNGSGKSTLLNMIAGNIQPSLGRIEIDGKVAILDYGSGFNGEFTGAENIFIKGIILGLTKKQIDERFQSIVEFSDISEFINQPVKTYSSGMISRLGFAIMAHVEADIIITDEALAVGDIFFVQKCMAYIRKFLKTGTFLFVSHSMNDVLSFCDHAVWLEKGVVKKMGAAKQVTSAYLDTATLAQAEEGLCNEATISEINKEKSNDDINLTQPELSQLLKHQTPIRYTDMRLKYPIQDIDRNDIQVIVPEDFHSGVGVGGAKIESVSLTDDNENPYTWVVGSEIVHLNIVVSSSIYLRKPVVGFQLMDRLGQALFAENSLVMVRNKEYNISSGETFCIEFIFQFPLLPIGEYVFWVSVANMNRDGVFIMRDQIENALSLHSSTSGPRHGLVGVPMLGMKLKNKIARNDTDSVMST